MILGVTDPEYEYTELKIFLDECDEYAFKEMINNQDYAELIKYIRSYVDNYSRVNYRALQNHPYSHYLSIVTRFLLFLFFSFEKSIRSLH